MSKMRKNNDMGLNTPKRAVSIETGFLSFSSSDYPPEECRGEGDFVRSRQCPYRHGVWVRDGGNPGRGKPRPYGLFLAFLLMPLSAFAAEEEPVDVACTGGQFQPCTGSDQCADYPIATLCIDEDFFDNESGKCQIPCEDAEGNPRPKDCSIGETCVLGNSENGDAYFCKKSKFVMDLNLLDTCIKHFVDNLIPPDVTRDNECSLISNLNQMLDQTNDGSFDIFDVDLCIREFLNVEESPCTCDGIGDDGKDRVFSDFTNDGCQSDDDCLDAGAVCDVILGVCKIEPDQIHRSETCATNSDCPHIGEICDETLKVCRLECESHSDCGDPSLSCNAKNHFCECNRPDCTDDSAIDPDGALERVFCINDEECGTGLFCDEVLHFCRRECGQIVNRASSDSTEVLNRTCFGNLKVCNPYRGRCEKIDPTELTCVVDTDCPSGAYCFVGECVPKCYTSIDCPDSKWYCAENNTCRPVPKQTDVEAEEPFDPMDYSLLFADRKVNLTAINDEYNIPLLIMNKKTRKQVFDDPTVVFGYRLDTTYVKKQAKICTKDYDSLFEEERAACMALSDPAPCLADIALKTNEVIKDCEISPDEEWITLLSPFGTVYGDGDPTINIKLNYAAVDLLSPGLYIAKLKAIFNNGQTDEITIQFNKESPNGDYIGSIQIYKNGKENTLATDILKMQIYVDLDAPEIEWDREVLKPNNILVEREFIDVTRGHPVKGYIDGNASIIFDNPASRNRSENEKIPVKGIYSPSLGRMRLISVIDMSAAPEACRSEDGDCDFDDPQQLKVKNIFGRDIRRLIEFLGPFDYRLGKYEGGYRETLSGLAPSNHDVTLEGEFITEHVKQEDDPIEIPEPLVPDRVDDQGTILPPQSVGFVSRYELVDELIKVTGKCTKWETFQSPEAFDQYINGYGGINYYQNMIRFEGEVGRALTELGNDPEDYLTLAEYLKGTIEFCPGGTLDNEGEPTEAEILAGTSGDDGDTDFQEDDYSDGLTCINKEKVACGLAYYRKVLLEMRSPNPDGREEECNYDGDCPDGLFCIAGSCQCTSDGDCGGGGVYCLDGKCMCDNDAQCASDGRYLVCNQGACICDANDQCAEGEICQSGKCVCADNSACEADEVCEGGACVCNNDSACGPNNVCENHSCICSNNDACFDGQICVNGACECDPSDHEGSCGEGWLCLEGKCQCNPDVADSCGAGRTCESGTCMCNDDSGCGPDEFCNPDAKVCQGLDEGWVDLGTVGQTEEYNSYTLFCPDIPLDGSDCLIPPKDNPALFTLHEHNRFFKEMVQTLSYQAGNALSDAFYVMYKAYQGDALDADSAYEYKELRLYEAVDNYEELRSELFGPINTAVMFEWPMRWFATVGDSILEYMHTAANDRLETMADIIDLRRRILRDTNEQDYIFVHHLLHEEYLTRVFLFVLQERWQGELFAYKGESTDMLDTGRNLLNRVNEMRNPLGLHPNRVYFENSDISLNNWQNYKKRTEEELTKADQSVNLAITEMKNALRDQDNLEAALQTAAHQFDATIEQMCGPASEYDEKCDVTAEERARAWTCDPRTDGDCPVWTCEDGQGETAEDRCDIVYKSFDEGVTDVADGDTGDLYSCRVNSQRLTIETNNQERLCVRGQMGTLLQEETVLEQQIKQVYQKVEILSRQIAREVQYLKDTQADNKELQDYIEGQNNIILGINIGLRTEQVAFDVLTNTVAAAKCIVILGFAAGTDCPQKTIATAIQIGTIIGHGVVAGGLATALEEMQHNREERLSQEQDEAEIRQLRLQLDNMTAQWENYLMEYEMLYQQLFNTQLRVEDTHYLAKRTAARYNDVVGSIVDRLIGRESGSVLLRNQMVQDANERFRITLEEAYKMTQAFTYRYNYGDQVHTTANKVFALQTVDDIRDFIEDLTRLEESYCGEQGLDCDYKNNQKIFRMSMRETLFPQYRDIIANGKVLTAGEQFHNTITSSLYTMKRNRASGIKQQIELPINIWVNRGGGAAGEDGYMVNPEECNHFIVGQRNGGATTAGTIAVNIIGSRLSETVEYELWRNDTDYVRSCKKDAMDPEFPTNVYTVGWAPQNENSDLDEPDTFLTHSQTFAACHNNWNLENPNTVNQEDSCYNFFARDRSLGTQDMTLVIPAVNDRQSWILGDGLADDEKPIIEDIILYFRYNSEPIFSDGE